MANVKLTVLIALCIYVGLSAVVRAANLSFPVDTAVSFSASGDTIVVLAGSTADMFTVSAASATVTVTQGISSSTFRSAAKAFVIDANTATATTTCTGNGSILTVMGTGATTFSLTSSACTGGTAYQEVIVGGGGGGSPAVPVASPAPPDKSLDSPRAPASTKLCAPYISLTRMIRPGEAHSLEVVRKVQEFLNEREGSALAVSGLYDDATVRAVKLFQQKYTTQILAPWGIAAPTGIIYTTTVAKMNALMCGASEGCPYFTTLVKPGASNVEVPKIKSLLNMVLGLTLDTSSEMLDGVAVAAVKQFQSRYRELVLKPWGLSRPTGWWYQTTVRQANKFMGCESGPLTLPNGAVIE